MKGQDWDIDVVKQFAIVFHRVTTGEEDDHLLRAILLQKCVEQEESTVGGADHVSLRQCSHRAGGLLLVHIDANGARPQRDSC